MRGSYFRALARLVVGLGISGALGIFGNIGTASAQAQTCVKYWTTFQTTSIPQSPDFDSYGEAASWVLGQYNAHSANSTWELARWSTVEPTGFAIAEYLKPTHSYNGYLNIAIWTRPCPFTISLAGAGSTHAMKAGPVVDMMAIVSGGAPEGTAVSISLNGSAALSGATNANGAYKFKYVPPETASSARLTATCTGCTNTASHGITVYGARLPDMCPRDPGSLLGNPIAAASGEKIQTEQDWQDASAHPLNITRGYRSYGNVDAGMGPNWSHNYLASLINEASGGRAVRLGEGTTIVFSRGPTGAWIADNGKDGLIDATGAITYVRASDESRWLFDANGRLLSITQRNGWAMTMAYTGLQLTTVTNAFGRTLRFIYDGSGKLVSIAPSGAAAISYGYDTAGRHARVTYQDGATRGYVYEDSRWPNALTGIVDEAGQRYATFSYDVAGRATGTSHALGAQYFAMSYDTAAGGPPGGSLTSATTIDPAIYRGTTQATNPLGQLQTYTYQGGDGTLRLLSAPGPFGGTWFNLRTLTGDNLPASETDFLGITTNYTWDAARQLKLSTTKAAGRPETQTDSTQWHPIFRLPVLVTQAGRRTAYTYDGAGNKLGETVTDTASGQTRATQWTYTTGGLIDTMTDAGGGVWRYSYDAQGNRTAVKNPLNQQVSYVYDGAGRVTQETAPNGLVTTYTWDARGRLLSRSVGGETSAYAYNTRGLLASAGLPNGHVVTYGYDAAQRLIGATDNRGNSVAYTLDAAGNRIREEVKDARGTIAQITGRVVDSFNRLVAVQGASGQTSQIAYDANGEPVSQTDPLNQTTARTLDALRRPVATAFADRTSTRQAWDALDQLTQVTDPKGVATRYGHNAFGDVVSETSPDIGTILYTRNATGDVIATRDARGQITSITRDILGRPTEIRYADNQASFLAYNADGHLVRIDDESGVTTFERDPQGRVITRSQGVSEKRGVSPSFKAGYTYENGDLSRVNYPSGLSVTYRRTNGLITGIDLLEPSNLKVFRPPVPFVKDLAWTALGQPKSWTWRNGDAAERRHDADGRMTSNELASYTYDAASRITGITQNLYAQVQGKPVTVTPLAFTAAYDARNRFTSFVRDGSETTYTYDANSNRLTAIDKVTSDTNLENAFTAVDLASTTSQALNIDAGSNRLLGLQLTVVGTSKGVVKSTVVTPVNYTLDENGAMISDGLRTFEYDAAQRLSRVKVFRSGEAASVNYQYNALGQRVFKGEYTAEQTLPSKANLGSGFVNWLKNNFGWLYAAAKKDASLGTAYVYGDEGTEMPAWALLGEYDNGRASGTGRSEYIWLPVAGGDAIPVGMYRNGQLYAIHSDHLGTPRLMTDDAKAVVWQWPYSAFGNNQPTGILKAKAKPKGAATQQPMLYEATAPVELNLRMPGQYFDFETGDSYNYFRNYDPRTGRYTQMDPIGLAGGLNGFAYVGGNPLSRIDPLGLQAIIVPVPSRRPTVVDPDFPPGVGPNHQSDSALQDLIEREANRREYKNACNEPPPPGLNACERAKWELKKWQSCKDLREANTNRWWGGKDTQHDVQLMTDIDANIFNAKRAIRRICKEECP